MDDKQYYSMKRITSFSVEQLQKNLKKLDTTNYSKNMVHQGQADAEMLLEKQNDFDNNSEDSFEQTV